MDDIVSQFMLNSCLTERRSNVRMLEGVNQCAHTNCPALSVVTGSVAELYIEPALSSIGDVDIMEHNSREIAVTDCHNIPRRLPESYARDVDAFELHDSVHHQKARNMPGYVYLLKICTIERQEDGSYTPGKTQVQKTWHPKYHYMLDNGTEDHDIHGPATKKRRPPHGHGVIQYFQGTMSTDIVFSVLSLVWPRQAADWPTRSRYHGWPDASTIERVVAYGCAIVPVTHRRCRQDEFMNKCQWRLSFSRAEVLLLNSWTPVQQIVYHMLRFLVKTERLSEQTDDKGEKQVSNYHIKTVMLWAAELKPQKWWNDDLDIVSICRQLLKMMVVWVDNADYKHYFIPQCNLIDWEGTTPHTQFLVSRLRSFANDSCLYDWFLRNYILPFVNNDCQRDVRMMFSDISSIEKLRRAVTAAQTDSRRGIHFARCKTVIDTYLFLSDTDSVDKFEANFQLLNISNGFHACAPQLRFACNAAWCLHTARRLHDNNFSKKVLDMATIIFLDGKSMRSSLELSTSTALHVGLYLMQSANGGIYSRALQSLQTEMSTAYLKIASSYGDFTNAHYLSNVYLAALYYSTEDYQTAMRICRMLTCSDDQPHCVHVVVEAKVLPPIGCDIDNTIGLVVLYHFVQTAVLNHHQQQQQHVSIFTAQRFACYLHVKCLLKLQSSEIELLRRFHYYRELLRANVEPFITDIILFQLLCVQLQHRVSVSSICLCQHDNINTSTQRSVVHYDTTRLQQLLVQAAVDQLTMFGQLQKQEFSPYGIMVYPNEFRAMLAYKNKNYVECFDLYDADISCLTPQRLWNSSDISLSITPSFFPLLDDDLIALRGLLLLLVGPSNTDICTYISSVAMRDYLRTKCWMKCPRLSRWVRSRELQCYLANTEIARFDSPYILNRLVLSFLYRQLILQLRRRNLKMV